LVDVHANEFGTVGLDCAVWPGCPQLFTLSRARAISRSIY
jgi:hypothetical protein